MTNYKYHHSNRHNRWRQPVFTVVASYVPSNAVKQNGFWDKSDVRDKPAPLKAPKRLKITFKDQVVYHKVKSIFPGQFIVYFENTVKA